jgi:hypothetical protein
VAAFDCAVEYCFFAVWADHQQNLGIAYYTFPTLYHRNAVPYHQLTSCFYLITRVSANTVCLEVVCTVHIL